MPSKRTRANSKASVKEEVHPETQDEQQDSKRVRLNTEKRLPKRKVALMIGYCGMGYSGSQINPQVETIEGRIFEALVKAGCVSEDNSESATKVNLQRSARTDAGVSAAINLLSIKLILNPTSLPLGIPLTQHINTFLPAQLRTWAYTRVTGSFQARGSCDSRIYEYNIPTYVFLPPKPGTEMAKTISRNKNENGSSLSSPSSSSESSSPSTPSFWQSLEGGLENDYKHDLAMRRKWRITPHILQHLRTCLKSYEGSNNFHNFTVGKNFNDRNAQRFMIEITASDPFVVENCEWVSLKFHGQSFMLHQIRKMVGLIVLVTRSGTPASLIPETYGPNRIHIPKAPALGLLLERPVFNGYNKKVDQHNLNIDERESAGRAIQEEKREYITDEHIAANVEEFKSQVIRPTMWEEELKSDVYATWLNFLDVYQGTDFTYLNSSGIIPSQAILKNVSTYSSSSTALQYPDGDHDTSDEQDFINNIGENHGKDDEEFEG